MADLLPEEQITKQAYDKHGHVWAKKYGDDKFYRREFSKFKELLPEGNILEIGSGSGRDAKVLVNLGYKYTGTDISESLLKIARKYLPGQIFLKQSVYALSFKNKFDGFWCTATLLHIPKNRVDEALVAIRSVVKDGAIGFITLKGGEGSEVEKYEIEKGVVLERFYQYWDKDEFIKTLAKSGFRVIDYEYRPESKRQKWLCFFVKADK